MLFEMQFYRLYIRNRCNDKNSITIPSTTLFMLFLHLINYKIKVFKLFIV